MHYDDKGHRPDTVEMDISKRKKEAQDYLGTGAGAKMDDPVVLGNINSDSKSNPPKNERRLKRELLQPRQLILLNGVSRIS